MDIRRVSHLPLVASLLAVPVLLSACKRNQPSSSTAANAPGTATPAATMEYEGSSSDAGSGTDATPAESSAGPVETLALDDAELGRFIAYRKELMPVISANRKKMNELMAKKADGAAAMEQIQAIASLTQELEKNTEDLRKKHGLTQDREQKIGDATSAIIAAKITTNPMIAQQLGELKKAVSEGGPAGAVAAATLKQLEDQDKASEAEARRRFGDAAVDVTLKHQAELAELQRQAIAMLGGGDADDGAAKQ